jgi:hypothetical protein
MYQVRDDPMFSTFREPLYHLYPKSSPLVGCFTNGHPHCFTTRVDIHESVSLHKLHR